MTTPRVVIGAGLRFRIDPRDVPCSKVARKLGLTVIDFNRLKNDLFARGFPRPDPTTGNYDLKAIEAWQDARSDLSKVMKDDPKPRDARDGFAERAARLLDGQG